MSKLRKAGLVTAATLAFTAAQALVHVPGHDLSLFGVAHAKGGNGGGGNGNGNSGGGNGNGNGNSGNGNGNGNSGSASAAGGGGKSGSGFGGFGQSKHDGVLSSLGFSFGGSGKSAGKGQSSKGFSSKGFSSKGQSSKGQSSKGMAAKGAGGKASKASAAKAAKADKMQAAKMDRAAKIASKQLAMQAKEKNLHARLAGLNSLNRSVKAYMNTQDPRMGMISQFVNDMVALEGLQADKQAVEAAIAEAMAQVGTLTAELGAIPGQIADLTAQMSEVGLTQEQIDALAGQIATLEGRMAEIPTEIAAAEQTVTDKTAELTGLETQIAAAELTVNDDSLAAALTAAANENRVAEYGIENYVDQSMLDWARDVLSEKADQMQAMTAEGEI